MVEYPCSPASQPSATLGQSPLIREARTALAPAGWRSLQLEIRLVSSWDRSVFFGAVLMWVFCTDLFRPITEDAPISFGRGPRCCEDFFVFDRELELQSLALVSGVGRPPFADPLTGAAVLLSTTLPCCPRGFVIDQTVSFDHVQSLGERRGVLVDGGKRPNLESHGVDHQCVAFVMAHGIPVPGWRHLRGMRLVHAHTPNFMIFVVKHCDLVGLLQQCHCRVRENKGHPFRPALVAWTWIAHARQ